MSSLGLLQGCVWTDPGNQHQETLLHDDYIASPSPEGMIRRRNDISSEEQDSSWSLQARPVMLEHVVDT